VDRVGLDHGAGGGVTTKIKRFEPRTDLPEWRATWVPGVYTREFEGHDEHHVSERWVYVVWIVLFGFLLPLLTHVVITTAMFVGYERRLTP